MTMTRLMATTTAVMASAAARTPVVVTGMTITAATTTASVRVVATLTTPAPKQRHLPLTGTSRTIRYHPPSLPRLLLRLPDGLLNLLLRRLRLLLPITNIILFHLLPLNLLHSLLNELGGNAHRSFCADSSKFHSFSVNDAAFFSKNGVSVTWICFGSIVYAMHSICNHIPRPKPTCCRSYQ